MTLRGFFAIVINGAVAGAHAGQGAWAWAIFSAIVCQALMVQEVCHALQEARR